MPDALSATRGEGRTWLDTLHEWVITVDHKKLGLMYIGTALFFLVLG